MKRRICLAWFGDTEPLDRPRKKSPSLAPLEPGAGNSDNRDGLPKNQERAPALRRAMRKH